MLAPSTRKNSRKFAWEQASSTYCAGFAHPIKKPAAESTSGEETEVAKSL